MIRLASVLAGLAVLGFALLLESDATTFTLQRADSARGHLVKGCYTLLDDLLRSSRPNGALRICELVSPLVLIPAASAIIRVGRSRTAD